MTVTADAQSRAYGAANPALTYGSTGLVNGDTLSGLLATTAATTSNIGSYAITQGTLAASSNYALSYVGANLGVTAASLTVTADAQSRAYGAANPALTYSSTGLVNGDTLSGLLTTTATTTSDVGSYAITQGTLAASSNYALSYVGADLDVTADAQRRRPVDGGADPAPIVPQTKVFPSDYVSNRVSAVERNGDVWGGNSFASANLVTVAGPPCTPAGVVQTLNRTGCVYLTGEGAASCSHR